jgi:hypothetical protein
MVVVLCGAVCSKTITNSIVVVAVSAPSSLPPVTRLRVTLKNALSSDTLFFPENDSTTPIEFSALFGISLPKSHSGILEITVEALDAAHDVVATGSQNVTIVVGGRADTTVYLSPTQSPDGGTPDSRLGDSRESVVEAPDGGSDMVVPDLPTVPDLAGLGGIAGGGGAVGTGGIPGTGGAPGAGGARNTGGTTFADGGLGGTTGTGGAPGTGGVSGQGGASGAGSGGRGGPDAATGGMDGSGGGAGGSTSRDGPTGGSDVAMSGCMATVVSNGYACGSAAPCSACKLSGVSKEAECQKGVDCLAKAGASCDSNCQLNCLNQAGDAQVGACIKALQTACASGC